jgi:hypothetical protein
MPSEFGFETDEDRAQAKQTKIADFEALLAELHSVAEAKDVLIRRILTDFILAHPAKFKEFLPRFSFTKTKKELKRELIKIEKLEGSIVYEAGLSTFSYAAQFEHYFNLETPSSKGKYPCYSWATRRNDPSIGVILFFAPAKQLTLGLYPPFRPPVMQFIKDDKAYEAALDKLASVLEQQTNLKCLRIKKPLT